MKENPARLLIVDANRGIREYFAVIGQKANFDVAKAPDGAEMERKVSSFSPTVIMLGLHGPLSDITDKLKLLNELQTKARVILLHGSDWKTLQTATQLGQIIGLNMSGTIQKPLAIGDVRDELARLRCALLEAKVEDILGTREKSNL